MKILRVAAVFCHGWRDYNVPQNLQIGKEVGMRKSIVVFYLMLFLFGALACTAEAFNIAFTYDNNGRLVKADYGPNGVINYSYDAAGNIATITSVGQGATTCSSEAVTLSDFDFTAGETTILSESSITVNSNIKVKSGAILNLKAPIVKMKPGFRAEPNSVLRTKSMKVSCP